VQEGRVYGAPRCGQAQRRRQGHHDRSRGRRPWAVEPVRERLELVVGHGGEQVGHDGAVKIPGALEVRNGVMGEARLEELLHRGRRAGREGGESQRCAYKGVRRGDGEVGVGDLGVGHAGASVARHLHRA
jgi:hypothetical protein